MSERVLQTTGPHTSVLVDEVLLYLDPQPNKVYLDVTFGSGGHTRAILAHAPGCRVIAMDWDMVSLDTYILPLQEEFGDRIIPLWGNFAHLYKLLKKTGIRRVDGILADFGTSQMQIRDRAGFSFYNDTPLDMRMSPSHQKVTAAEMVNTWSVNELRDLFSEYGQERHANKIAKAIVHDRVQTKFNTTRQLASLIERITPKNKKQHQPIHPATRVFQALRIAVNKELDNIRAFLPEALRVLPVEGRLVCISFHSLEDRLVKQFFTEQEAAGYINILTKKVVSATQQEVTVNPSARSAKLRAAELIRPYLR